MILFSAVVFTTFPSDFCLARAALDPNPSSDWQELSVQRTGHRMKECCTNRDAGSTLGCFPHKAKLKDQFYPPKVGKPAKLSLGSRLQAEERKIYHELITIGHLSSASYKTPV